MTEVLNGVKDGLNDTLETMNDDFSENLHKMGSDLEGATDKLSVVMNDVNKSLGTTIRSMSEDLKENLSSMSTNLQKATDNISTSIDSMSESVNAAMNEVAKNMKSTANIQIESSEEFKDISGSLNASVIAMTSMVEKVNERHQVESDCRFAERSAHGRSGQSVCQCQHDAGADTGYAEGPGGSA